MNSDKGLNKPSEQNNLFFIRENIMSVYNRFEFVILNLKLKNEGDSLGTDAISPTYYFLVLLILIAGKKIVIPFKNIIYAELSCLGLVQ